jgi:hypothetical protein
MIPQTKASPRTFPEPKTRPEWNALIKAMKCARAEDYPDIDPARLLEFRRAITTGVRIASLPMLIILILYVAFAATDTFVFQTKHGGGFYLLMGVLPIAIALLGGAIVRGAQRRAIDIGREIGLIL